MSQREREKLQKRKVNSADSVFWKTKIRTSTTTTATAINLPYCTCVRGLRSERSVMGPLSSTLSVTAAGVRLATPARTAGDAARRLVRHSSPLPCDAKRRPGGLATVAPAPLPGTLRYEPVHGRG